jgi:hypothetical protein
VIEQSSIGEVVGGGVPSPSQNSSSFGQHLSVPPLLGRRLLCVSILAEVPVLPRFLCIFWVIGFIIKPTGVQIVTCISYSS